MAKGTLKNGLLWAVLLAAALALISLPGETMAAARDGLQLCYNVIIPSLFPFFVLSSLLVELGLAAALGRVVEGLMFPLFRVSGAGASALVLGLIGGYPVGARTALELYQSGQCSREEAERLLCFCNNSGPAFILGVVGAGVFQSTAIGLLLYGVHITAALTVGVLFRIFCPTKEGQKASSSRAVVRTASAAGAFTSSIKGALTSTLNICAFVVCFTILLRLLTATGVLTLLARGIGALLAPLGFDQTWAVRLLTGLLEISTGVASLAGKGHLTGRIALAAFILGWSGLSVHCQTAALLEGSGLRTTGSWIGKLLHGIFSAILALAACRVTFRETPVAVFGPAVPEWGTLAELPNLAVFSLALALATAVSVLFLLRYPAKKRRRKRKTVVS